MSIYFSTNIPEMRSILTFNRTSDRISTILQRLESGLRINAAKDDPSGLTTREIMRAEIKGLTTAKRNNGLADGLLSAADTGMANIGNLLYGNPNDSNDTGLLGLIFDDSYSSAAKREQIFDILNQIDNIANTTTYNGRSILNGSLDYQTASVDSRQISQLQVHRADLQGSGNVKATINVQEAAEKATLRMDQSQIGNNDVLLELNGGTTYDTKQVLLEKGFNAQEIVDTVNKDSQKTGVTARIEEGLVNKEFLISGVGENNDIVFTMKDGSNESFKVVLWRHNADPATTTISTIQGDGSDADPYVFNVQYADSATASEIVSYLNGPSETNSVLQKFQSVMSASLASGQTGAGTVSDSDTMATFGDVYSGNGIQLTGDSTKAKSVEFIHDNSAGERGLWISYTAQKLEVHLATNAAGEVTSTAQDVVNYLNSPDVLNNADTGLSASILRPDGQSYQDDTSYTPGYGLMSASGPVTMERFNQSGYKTMDAVTTGQTGIVFESVEYGSKQNLSVTDLSGSATVTIVDADGKASDSATGKDMVATVNGLRAATDGNRLSFSSDNLSFSATLSDAVRSGDQTTFRITGGGATFQIGGNVTSGNQLKLGIQSVSTGRLGGQSGVLAQLRNLDYDNEDDQKLAYSIVNEAISSLATSRSRIGAVQKSVLAPNATSLDEQITVTTEAEALISNADTAVESSRLAREELLAEAAMDSILYSRAFAQYMIRSLL